MKIIILAAMDKELQLMKEILDQPEDICLGGINLSHGSVKGHEVYIGKCGIGKVNAAINAMKLIDSIHPDLIINSGVAGGAGIPVGSVLVATQVAYDDVWCGPGTEYGNADGCPLFFTPDNRAVTIAEKMSKTNAELMFGLICSGDKFISTSEEISFIRNHFPEVKAVDMESAAIAQACYLTSTPFNIIRVVSDTPGEGENISQYQNFWSEAPAKTFMTVKEIIGAI